MNFRARHDIKAVLATKKREETQLFNATLNNSLTFSEKADLAEELGRVRASIARLHALLTRSDSSELRGREGEAG